jgi:hypothetical protein
LVWHPRLLPHKTLDVKQDRVLAGAHDGASPANGGSITLFEIVLSRHEVYGYYIADEIRCAYRDMMLAIEEPHREIFQTMTPRQLGATLVMLAVHVNLAAFRSHPRGPKKSVPKRTRFAKHTHVSTARLLADATSKKTP